MASTVYHFSDRLFRALLYYGRRLVLPFLNWMFGTDYTGAENVCRG